MKNILISATLAILSLSSAFATPVTWNLTGSTSQLLGTSTTLVSTTGNISMVFTGYVTNSTDVPTSNTWVASTATTSALYAKVGAGDETGLGIAADPTGDHEIFKNSYRSEE